jgi:hypothetical protein
MKFTTLLAFLLLPYWAVVEGRPRANFGGKGKGKGSQGSKASKGKGKGKGMGKGMMGKGMMGKGKGKGIRPTSPAPAPVASNAPTPVASNAPTPSAGSINNGTIVDFVVGNPDLTSLTAAVVRAELVDVLNSEGPLTLFAPNNDAFDDAPFGIFDQLFVDLIFIPQLADILLLSMVYSSDLEPAPVLVALNGEPLVDYCRDDCRDDCQDDCRDYRFFEIPLPRLS